MVTKEQLIERRAQLEDDLRKQNELAAQANAQVQDGQRRLTQCRDLINALSGAKQDVDHWLKNFPADPPAAEPPAADPAVDAGDKQEKPN